MGQSWYTNTSRPSTPEAVLDIKFADVVIPTLKLARWYRAAKQLFLGDKSAARFPVVQEIECGNNQVLSGRKAAGLFSTN